MGTEEVGFNKFACFECKKRRTRCSKTLPVCVTCQKMKRQCLYDPTLKTPLTRRHLTNVEEELGLIKQVHQRLLPHLDYYSVLKNIRSGVSLEEAVMDYQVAPSADLAKMVTPPQLPGPELAELNHRPTDPNLQIAQVIPSSLGSGPETDTTSVSPFSSNSHSNNQWDERTKSANARSPFMINGMATIDSDIFLGTTSSAALINLVGGEYFLHESTSGPETVLQEPRIPDRLLIEHYVSSYFDTYHILYPIVNKPLFLAQFNDIVQAPPGWQSLLYIVAALGSFMSAETSERNDDLGLFHSCKLLLSMDDFETGNLTLVQTLALMSNYLQKRDKPNSGYNYLGLAVRMAMGLGLHKEIKMETHLFNREMRKRIWWCLYIFDCGQTITYGRPLGLPCAGIDAELPYNVVDSNLTSSTNIVPHEENAPTVYTCIRLQLQFHMLTNSIYERIISEPYPTASELLAWDIDYIQRWRSMIPEYFGEEKEVAVPFMLAHAVLHWRCRNFRIIMYRTFAIRAGNTNALELQARQICLEECKATIQSITRFWDAKPTHNRMDTWYSLYFLIPAVVMPLICLRNYPDDTDSAKLVDDIVMSEQLVNKLVEICPAASRILDLIISLGWDHLPVEIRDNRSDRLMPSLDMEDSPISQLMQLHSMLKPGFFD